VTAVTRATLQAMLRRADECDRAQRYGWPINSKNKLLREASEDVKRLVAEVERLKASQ
jgi:hypothetical protein